VEVLIETGADFEAKHDLNQTALECAAMKINYVIFEIQKSNFGTFQING
jgi:hypothetical protein